MAPGTVGQIIMDIAARFSAAGLESARLDARMLIGHALGVEPSMLFSRADQFVDAGKLTLIEKFAVQRLAQEPVSRIIGRREFWSLPFQLSPDTLDPRPDTETVVSAALDLKPRFSGKPVQVLDLGTGTGCILLAILNAWPEAMGQGIDINEGAVEVARTNARQLGLADRASFRIGDWCADLSGNFDLIVSNPPYITDAEMLELAPEVSRFDPHLALRGGADGLSAYRALVPGAHRHLAHGGRLLLEVGAAQTETVGTLLADGGFRVEAEHKDLGGFVRCLQAVTA